MIFPWGSAWKRYSILASFSVTVLKHEPRATWRKKVFLWLIRCSPSPTEAKTGIQDRIMEVETEAETWPLRNAAYWLYPRLTLNYISYVAQAHLPRDDTARHGLDSPALFSI